MQNVHLDLPHITRSSERAEEANLILEKALKLLEQHRDVVGTDNYTMARGWLTHARDYRNGLEGKNIVGRYQQSHTYLEQAQETLQKIKQLTSGNYST